MQSKTPISNEAAVAAAAPRGNYRVALARSEEEVLEAQRLRYKVFVEELGARVQTRLTGHDIDHYDRFCDHLIVRDTDSGRIVGTYRILSPAAARRVGNYYSENEFHINRLHHLRNRMVEVGRSCIHQDHRSGAVITLLWAGLADYMVSNGYDYLIGCASIGMADGGHNAANLFQQIGPEHMSLETRLGLGIRKLRPSHRVRNGLRLIDPPNNNSIQIHPRSPAMNLQEELL